MATPTDELTPAVLAKLRREHRKLVRRHLRFYRSLHSGDLEPTTAAQRRFVEVAKGKAPAATDHERAYAAFLALVVSAPSSAHADDATVVIARCQDPHCQTRSRVNAAERPNAVMVCPTCNGPARLESSGPAGGQGLPTAEAAEAKRLSAERTAARRAERLKERAAQIVLRPKAGVRQALQDARSRLDPLADGFSPVVRLPSTPEGSSDIVGRQPKGRRRSGAATRARDPNDPLFRAAQDNAAALAEKARARVELRDDAPATSTPNPESYKRFIDEPLGTRDDFLKDSARNRARARRPK